MPAAQGRGASDRPLGGRAPTRVRAGARRRKRAGARPLGGRLRGSHRARAALHALTAGRGARLLGVRRRAAPGPGMPVSEEARRSEEHTSELQSQSNLVCRLLLEKKIRKVLLRSEEHTSELHSQSNIVCRLLLDKRNFLNEWTSFQKSISIRNIRIRITCTLILSNL